MHPLCKNPICLTCICLSSLSCQIGALSLVRLNMSVFDLNCLTSSNLTCANPTNGICLLPEQKPGVQCGECTKHLKCTNRADTIV